MLNLFKILLLLGITSCAQTSMQKPGNDFDVSGINLFSNGKSAADTLFYSVTIPGNINSVAYTFWLNTGSAKKIHILELGTAKAETQAMIHDRNKEKATPALSAVFTKGVPIRFNVSSLAPGEYRVKLLSKESQMEITIVLSGHAAGDTLKVAAKLLSPGEGSVIYIARYKVINVKQGKVDCDTISVGYDYAISERKELFSDALLTLVRLPVSSDNCFFIFPNYDAKIGQVELKGNKIDVKKLQGLWAETRKGSAYFLIQNDSIYYPHHDLSPCFFSVSHDTLTEICYPANEIRRSVIKKLDNDSLILMDLLNGEIIRLHKRK